MVKSSESLTHKANTRNNIEKYFKATKLDPLDDLKPKAEKLAKDTKAELKWNLTTGTPQSFQGELSVSIEGPPPAAAKYFLLNNSSAFGIKETFEDFIEVDTITWGGFNHSRFQQAVEGIQVFASQMVVGLDEQNAVRSVFSNYHKNVPTISEKEQISKKIAIETATKDLGDNFKLRGEIKVNLMWYPTLDGYKKSFHVIIPAENPLGDWEYFIDVEKGEILDSYNMMCFFRRNYAARGEIYRINPDSDLETVTLRNLKPPRRRLIGKYAKILNEDGPEATARSRSLYDRRFFYDPNNTHFDEVQLYYSIEKVYEYFRSLGFRGFTTKNRNKVLTGNVHVGTNFDNAYYSTVTGQIYFGDGSGPPAGFNDLAQEIDIVAHEFTHAVIDEYVSIYGTEGRALHEGYADYFACSLTNDPNLGQWVVPGGGNFMRTLINALAYPGPSPLPHRMGQIWGGACWQLRNELGKDISDYLIFGSILFLSNTPTFQEAKDRILYIDKLFMGSHYEHQIRNIFENQRAIPV